MPDASAAAQGTVEVTTLHIFSIPVDLIGFQGGIIVGVTDRYCDGKAGYLLREESSGSDPSARISAAYYSGQLFPAVYDHRTGGERTCKRNYSGACLDDTASGSDRLCGVLRRAAAYRHYRTSSCVGAIESQLLVDTGRNFLNPLMSVAIIAQGGAVLGYLARNMKDAKAKELCIPSFISVLFGITEPALFGVNLRYRYPLIGGCIGGAIGGAVVYFTDLAALGFGTTVVPGIALADPAHNGYVNYIIAHVIALAAGFLFAFILGIGFDRKKTSDAAANTTAGNGKHSAQIPSETAGSQKIAETNASAGAVQTGQDVLPEEIGAFTSGEFIGIEKVKDPTFAQKILGDGVAIVPSEGKIYAPCDASVEMVMDTKHAVGLRTAAGNGILIHVGIDTVNLQGKYIDVHVTDGQSIRKGDLIMDFDKDKIAAEGYDTSACLIFTEPVDGAHIDREPEHTVKAGEKIAVIAK